jgi:hypothetical protein
MSCPSVRAFTRVNCSPWIRPTDINDNELVQPEPKPLARDWAEHSVTATLVMSRTTVACVGQEARVTLWNML